MKQPKRSGLAWSHGRDAALLRAVSSRSSTTHPPTNPITTGTMSASATWPQWSLNCGLRALAPSPTSSLSTDLLALSGRDGEWASPSLPVVPLYSLECKLYKHAVTWPSRERDTALRSDPGDTRQVRGCARPPRPARISPPSQRRPTRSIGASSLHLRPADLLPTSECLGIP